MRFDYEGHIVKAKAGNAKYRVICRDPYNFFVLQSERSHDKLIRLSRRQLEKDWEVIK